MHRRILVTASLVAARMPCIEELRFQKAEESGGRRGKSGRRSAVVRLGRRKRKRGGSHVRQRV